MGTAKGDAGACRTRSAAGSIRATAANKKSLQRIRALQFGTVAASRQSAAIPPLHEFATLC